MLRLRSGPVMLVLLTASLAATILAPNRSTGDEMSAAYFMFEQYSPKGENEQFIFKLVDEKRITEARAILAGKINKKAVQGQIIKARAPYNPHWSFHLDPPSTSFFENAIEVCDANVTYVEEHLDEVGGSALPGGHWCPWSSRLTAEITKHINPGTEMPRP